MSDYGYLYKSLSKQALFLSEMRKRDCAGEALVPLGKVWEPVSVHDWQYRSGTRYYFYTAFICFLEGVMKFVDIYFDYKSRYEEYIILYKVGNFYNVLGKDTIIIHELLNYQIKDHNGIDKIGFPIMSLEKVLRILSKNKLNYIVLEKEDGIVKIVTKKRNKVNSYNEYGKSANALYSKKEKINHIIELLNEKIEDPNFDRLLQKVEDVCEG